MKAVFQSRYGKPQVLECGDMPEPEIAADEVLIQNLATSVNPRDCLIRAGRYQLQFLVPKFPFIPGSDCYGTVLSTGQKVKGFKAGDKVYGLKNPSHGLGSYAQRVAIAANNISRAPDNLSDEQIAAVPLCALTAWQALFDHGALQKRQKVLILGASGGVGTFAVQIAKAAGAVVHGLCSSENRALVEELGASRVIDYKQQDISAIDEQYDVIFDTIGRYSPAKVSHLMAQRCNFVTTVPTPGFMVKHLTSKLLSAFSIPHSRKRVVMVTPNQQQLSSITRLIEQQQISPVIDSVFSMTQADLAHERSQSKRAVGKIIIKTSAQ